MAQQNKTILISGGVTGIGRATALRFLEIGWQVVDPDGNVVSSGTLTRAEMTSELIQKIAQEE